MGTKKIDELHWLHQYPRGPELSEEDRKELMKIMAPRPDKGQKKKPTAKGKATGKGRTSPAAPSG